MKNDVSKKKTSKEKRVLIAALCIAATVAAGSTFAWFSSKDEVTNRLSASAAYDVSIAEDFQPPEDWIPGQTINKDVSAVNTGNVDAFVRMWLEGEMSVLNRTAATVGVPTTAPSGALASEVTDERYKALGLNFSDSNKNYYRELSTLQRKNSDLNGTTNDEANNQPATFSEVQSVQAGGELVYAPANAGYHWTLEQQTTMNVDGTTVTDLPKNTVVGTGNSTASGVTKISAADTNYYGAIDASTFTPETEGLYIFRRNVTLDSGGNTVDTYEYSGYYFVPAASSATRLGLTTARDVYLALYTDTNGNSDYTLPAGAITATPSVPSQETVYPVTITDVDFYTAKETVIKNDSLTWSYDNTSGLEKLTATYPGADGKVGDDATTTTVDESLDDIVIDVALANIGTSGQTWTAKTAAGKTATFYYNDDVEAGDTTTKLVDSVKLADSTTQHAYLAFDFDLNVFLESIQVTMTEDGMESTAPITTSWAVADGSNIVASGTATEAKAAEIADIAWN
jgi:predicted ribosomally synthesized peptide with SipW-like signal peptide